VGDAVAAPGRPHPAPPLLDQCPDQLAVAGIRPRLRTVLAGSGYVTEDNFARAGQQKVRLLAPLGKDPATHRTASPGGRRDLAKLPATARAVRRMRHHRGRAGCKLPAQTVEPVSGQIKTCQKMTAMSRRGFGACRSEWLLADMSGHTADRVRRLATHSVDKGPLPGMRPRAISVNSVWSSDAWARARVRQVATYQVPATSAGNHSDFHALMASPQAIPPTVKQSSRPAASRPDSAIAAEPSMRPDHRR
jgi:hypothetical protein